MWGWEHSSRCAASEWKNINFTRKPTPSRPRPRRRSIARARESRRIVAVGTTTVRTLEYAAQQAGEIRAASGEAKLFIYPGYKFQVVQALLTNFHLPQSTLLMLVCALAGKENVMRAYEHAVRERTGSTRTEIACSSSPDSASEKPDVWNETRELSQKLHSLRSSLPAKQMFFVFPNFSWGA